MYATLNIASASQLLQYVESYKHSCENCESCLKEDELKQSKEPKPRDRETEPCGNEMDLVIEVVKYWYFKD